MIKLNNKNITYVALADSNNSIKAPKEIWYADSNNSVKLVYRRKDALIEGEDYEKYQWLKGDGSAVINTNIEDITNLTELYCYFYSDNPSKNERIFGREGNSRIVLRYSSVNNLDFFTSLSNNPEYITLRFNTEGYFYADFIANQASTSLSRPTNFIGNSDKIGNLGTIHLFGDKVASGPTSIVSAKIKSFRAAPFVDLIPCRLLRPIPKWLDANGIRRQVGECGMIDLVSGKFYGNVNSVGTFTVENYYERKEWLVGDGSAFLSTTNGLTGLNSVEWELSGNGQAILNSFRLTNGAAQFVSDLSYVDGSIGKIGIYDNNRAGYFWTTKLDVNTLRLVSGTTIKAITINDVDLSNPNYQWDGSFILQFINRAAGYKVSKVTVDGTERYIPCTLTMDLPASMDANNIARTKGTSGMWDLVSDRFYGNVANSGTFKAVNLAEGVDYEVHQWLKGDGSAYIEGIEYDLWNNHLQVRIGSSNDRISYFSYSGSGNDNGYLNVSPSPKSGGWYLMFVFRQTASPASHIGDIDPISSVPNTLDLDFYIDNSIFYCKQNGVINENAPQTSDALQSSWTSITPIIPSNKVSYIRELLPNNTYRSNLIPVKLLKSIPAKYDANGIARQAGECGMYDTVNDVFYGNVASSGSFTVEDDN